MDLQVISPEVHAATSRSSATQPEKPIPREADAARACVCGLLYCGSLARARHVISDAATPKGLARRDRDSQPTSDPNVTGMLPYDIPCPATPDIQAYHDIRVRTAVPYMDPIELLRLRKKTGFRIRTNRPYGSSFRNSILRPVN